ncbi:molybdate ABC transporter substrate-binding protein [Brevibacillus borstelensis]|uniref:molybdate ABC transporter substrate-binding protein n=1 Tax=Brevibacillus borstelensis TaxID=45462 RepID=UPI002E1C28E3|nr:molybdate ABC transporter substrate-binding protein [Brevibacillus borstelensis]MED1875093.1 molybdate ABC transporter substrate-binding protein [Brevibacillus borstelensis]
MYPQFRKYLSTLLFAILLLMAVGCSTQTAQPQSQQPDTASQSAEKPLQIELMVSAAASLTDALNEIKPLFEQEHPGVTLTYVLGSSGKLATQIEQGAPTDVFLSASKKDMDKLEEKQLIQKDSRTDFAKNALVLVVGKESTLSVGSFEDLTKDEIKHLAVGQPDSVPAGRYAKEALEHLKLWEPLADRLVFGSDVRQVLTFVESGNAEAGIVYASDAAISEKVKVAAKANEEWHKPIVYPGAITSSTEHADLAKAFIAYLSSEKGKEILQKYGFQ